MILTNVAQGETMAVPGFEHHTFMCSECQDIERRFVLWHNRSAGMKEQCRPECVVEEIPEDPSCPDGPTDMYLILDGKRIAKRGRPGTPHAMTWISLEPGVVVRDVPMAESDSGWGMVIEIKCASALINTDFMSTSLMTNSARADEAIG